MGEANEVAENGYMRDLLQRFTAGNHHRKQTEYKSPNEEETEEMELNLGLSLGGCFGVDPKEKRLIRSSSISGSTRLIRNEDLTLTRTSSLPVETEEERRKRKELQSLRRLEAMRKRSEKQRNFRVGKDGASLGGICEEDKVVVEEEEEEEEERLIMPILGSKLKIEQQFNMVSKGFSPSVGLLNWVAPVPALRGFVQPLSQGSIGSQGSSSSGISEFESRPSQGLNNSAEGRRSPASVQSLPEQYEQKPIIAPRARSATTEKSDISTGVEVEENPSKKAKVTEDNGSTREMGMKVMEEMPYVSTTGGDGPNGKRIEGFLYKYRKGEEVRIMCVCHGNFLSPAEFVKHAGGGDVEHPLRHIVVNPSHSLL